MITTITYILILVAIIILLALFWSLLIKNNSCLKNALLSKNFLKRVLNILIIKDKYVYSLLSFILIFLFCLAVSLPGMLKLEETIQNKDNLELKNYCFTIFFLSLALLMLCSFVILFMIMKIKQNKIIKNLKINSQKLTE